MPCRRGAWPFAAHPLLKVRRIAVRPHLTPGLDLVGRHHFLLAPLLDGERQPIRHHEGREPTADGLLPQQLRRRLRPVHVDGLLGVVAIAQRSAEVGPVGRCRFCLHTNWSFRRRCNARDCAGLLQSRVVGDLPRRHGNGAALHLELQPGELVQQEENCRRVRQREKGDAQRAEQLVPERGRPAPQQPQASGGEREGHEPEATRVGGMRCGRRFRVHCNARKIAASLRTSTPNHRVHRSSAMTPVQSSNGLD